MWFVEKFLEGFGMSNLKKLKSEPYVRENKVIFKIGAILRKNEILMGQIGSIFSVICDSKCLGMHHILIILTLFIRFRYLINA